MRNSIFTITINRPLTSSVYEMRLAGDTSGILPGQFVNVRVPGVYLRRPISVCGCGEGILTLVYKTVGRGTEAMAALRPGEPLDLLTGLGNGFDLSCAGPSPLLIGGGTGLSPLYGLARRLLEAGCEPRVILGFRSADDMFALRLFHALGLYPSVTTEDGSFGIRGFVTEAMSLPHSYLYACGPEAMLRAVSERSETGGQLSFDVRMGCGFGACMGCTKQTVNGPRRVCKDGPVFRKEEILWED